MNDLVTLEAQRLQDLYRESAALRVFIERLTDPEAWGWIMKDQAPEVFRAAVEIRKGWEK